MTNYEKLCEAVEIKTKIKRTPIGNVVYPLPAFTAEKQIELIKLISQENFVSNYVPKKEYWVLMTNDYASHNNDFTEALAGLTLQLIKAGELEKDEIRRILE